MPCRYGTSPAQRLRSEFVEADLDAGFYLTDKALAESRTGQKEQATRHMAEAEAVMRAAEDRIVRLDAQSQLALEPLVGELRRAILRAKRGWDGG